MAYPCKAAATASVTKHSRQLTTATLTLISICRTLPHFAAPPIACAREESAAENDVTNTQKQRPDAV